MRILHITETLTSGVLKYLQEVTAIEDHTENQHYILYSRRDYTPVEVSSLFSSKVILIEENIRLKNAIGSMRLIHNHIRRIDPDIVHLHSSIAGFLGRLSAVLFPRITVYYTPHGYSFLMSHKGRFIRAIYWTAEFVLTQLRGNVVACSKSEFNHARMLSPFRKVRLVENCINIRENSGDVRKLPNKQIIGVGRIEEQKNPKLFVRIAAALRKIDPGIHAVWIGDGSLRKDCEELNDSLKGNVQFTGWLSNEETLRYLQQSTIFVQTSKWEGLPYSVLEAISVGLPIVASNIRSHTDLIGPNYEGIIARNEEEFVSAIIELIGNVEHLAANSLSNKDKLRKNYIEFAGRISLLYLKNKFL